MNTTDDEGDVLELLRREAAQGRQHTGDLSWHDRSPSGKSLGERGWLEALIEELKVDGVCTYMRPVACNDEWPDCEAVLTSSGEHVAVEVSEVVRGASLAPAGRPEPWTQEEFIEAVQGRIAEKDAKGFHGELYGEYLLLLHTDELFLTAEWVTSALDRVTFELPHGNIDTAFLVLGYRRGRRAYFPLSLAS